MPDESCYLSPLRLSVRALSRNCPSFQIPVVKVPGQPVPEKGKKKGAWNKDGRLIPFQAEQQIEKGKVEKQKDEKPGQLHLCF